MLQRKTQTAAFWRDQFEVTEEDLDYFHSLIIDAEKPLTTEQLAHRIIEEYQRRETNRMESELSKGTIYQPAEEYDVGQILVFPALDFSVAEVTDTRTGKNPEHGSFDVVTVKFEETNEEREFAANLQTPHRLNQPNGQGLSEEGALLSAVEIYDLYSEEIEESILYALEEGERAEGFVQVDDYWLLADQLAEIHVGHLNIAEALIELEGQPVAPEEILDELELDSDVSKSMQAISLNHALSQDERFDKIGRGTDHLWFLRRLEPEVAVSVPPLLRPHIPRYNRALLSVELLQIEWELDDEWGESGVGADTPSVVPSTSFFLTYPHRYYGTIPLSTRTRSFFPEAKQGRSMVTVIDGRWGNRTQAWVVHEDRYVSGLGKWMEEHNLPVGAQITLERTNTPGEVVLDYRPRRMKREWSRFLKVDADEMTVDFEMNKIQISCEYDEYLVVSVDDVEAIDAMRRKINEDEDIELDQIVEMLVPELTQLSPQGTVHAKTVYSAVNILYRCPPGPIFYSLISNRVFQDTGGGFFAVSQ